MDIPDVRYARSGDVAIAYQTIGEGPVDAVFVRGFAGDLLSVWEQPLFVRFIEDVASFARVTMVDKRGTGLSGRVREVPTLETRMDDLRAVMDAIGAEQAVLWRLPSFCGWIEEDEPGRPLRVSGREERR